MCCMSGSSKPYLRALIAKTVTCRHCQGMVDHMLAALDVQLRAKRDRAAANSRSRPPEPLLPAPAAAAGGTGS